MPTPCPRHQVRAGPDGDLDVAGAGVPSRVRQRRAQRHQHLLGDLDGHLAQVAGQAERRREPERLGHLLQDVQARVQRVHGPAHRVAGLSGMAPCSDIAVA